MPAAPIHPSLNPDQAPDQAGPTQTAGATFQCDASLADKIVIFEIVPEVALDMANGFKTIALQTSASNASNITEATLFIVERYQGYSAPSAYTN